MKESYPVPKCLVCGESANNNSMVSSKLLQNLTTKHISVSQKNKVYFRCLMDQTKKQVIKSLE